MLRKWLSLFMRPEDYEERGKLISKIEKESKTLNTAVEGLEGDVKGLKKRSTDMRTLLDETLAFVNKERKS